MIIVGIFFVLWSLNMVSSKYGFVDGYNDGRIIEMPLADVVPEDQVTWLDNYRIAFCGYNPAMRGYTDVFRWDTPDHVERIFAGVRRFCFDGETLYIVKKDGDILRRYVIAGPNFSSSVEVDILSVNNDPGFFDKGLCMERSIPKILLGHIWKPLGVDKGYLDFGAMEATDGPIHVSLIDKDGVGRRELGLILKKQILPVIVPTHKKSTYFLYPANLSAQDKQEWQNRGYLESWFIQESGDVETVHIPYGVWATNSGSMLMLPVKNGFVIVVHGFDANGEPGSAGAYHVLANGKSERIVSGFAGSPSISPDGCRLAFIFKRYLEMRGSPNAPTRKLVALTICN